MSGILTCRQLLSDILKSEVSDVGIRIRRYGEIFVRVVDNLKSEGNDFDPLGSAAPDKFGEFNIDYPFPPEKILNNKLLIVDPYSPNFNPVKFDDKIVSSHYDYKFHVVDKIGRLSSPQFLCSDPGKIHFAERSKYVQWLRYLDPNHMGSAYKFRSDFAYKESKQNTGMSGGGEGEDKEPTKDDERTLAWKLRFSVEAETPKFIARASISLEKKSG